MPKPKKLPPRLTLAAFHEWAREAPFNAELIYHVSGEERHETLFKYARKLQHAGLCCLFQKRYDSEFAYIAKRSPVLAHVALDNLSASIHVRPSSEELASRETL